MITLKEAFEDLHERMTKQLAEKVWEIERIKELKDKSEEFYGFAGPGVVKGKLLAKLQRESEEREKNIQAIEKILEEGKVVINGKTIIL
jgi:D-mannonate dehydratase